MPDVPVPERGFALSPCGTSEAAYERSVGLLVLATGYGLRLACSDAAVAVFVVLLSLLLLCASLEAVPLLPFCCCCCCCLLSLRLLPLLSGRADAFVVAVSCSFCCCPGTAVVVELVEAPRTPSCPPPPPAAVTSPAVAAAAAAASDFVSDSAGVVPISAMAA